MKRYKHYAESIRFKRQGGHWRPIITDSRLSFAGEGRSAAVFRIADTNKALKVFYPDKVHIAKEEADIYRLLSGIPQYPTLYEAGGTYIVIDWVEGRTFFQCLEEGIDISTRHIQEADQALLSARKRGLNPSDVHLRNIMVTSTGSTMIIDVARFRQEKDCMNWEDIKTAYSVFYTKPFFPKRWPKRLLNTLGLLYKMRLLPVHRTAAKNPQ